MLKKNETIEILKNGGHITLCEIYRSATVYSAAGDDLGRCRYDTAEKIGTMDGFQDRRIGTGWEYTRRIEQAAAAVEAVEDTQEQEQQEQEQPAAPIDSQEIRAALAAAAPVCQIVKYGYVWMLSADNRLMRAPLEDAQADPVEDPWVFVWENPAAARVAVRDPKTEEILEGSPRAIYHAIAFRVRFARHHQEDSPAWEPLTDNAARIIAAAHAVTRGPARAAVLARASIRGYKNHRTQERTQAAAVALQWHRAGDLITVARYVDGQTAKYTHIRGAK